MPLAICPDCHRQVSTAALSCPGCGRPLTSPNYHRTVEQTGKPHKLLLLLTQTCLIGCLLVMLLIWLNADIFPANQREIWLTLGLIGLPIFGLLYLLARFLIWWDHA